MRQQKEKLRHNQKKKKRKKNNHGTNERLNIVQLVLDLLLASLTFSRYFSLSFLFPSFHSFSSLFLSPGLLCRRFESLFLSRFFPFTPVPFVSISLVHSLFLFLFLLFYFIFLYFNFSLSHFSIHISHSHICYSLVSNIKLSILKKTTLSIYVFHSLSPFSRSLSHTRPTAKRQMANVTYCKEIINSSKRTCNLLNKDH